MSRVLTLLLLLAAVLSTTGFQAPSTTPTPTPVPGLGTPVRLPAPNIVPSPQPGQAARNGGVPTLAPGVLPEPLGTATAQATSPVSPRPESDDQGQRYAGWVVHAYPELSTSDMGQLVGRLKGASANVVWIGHNNPGEVNRSVAEPALSYAVYEALQNPSDPRYPDAVAILAAQERMLQAVRAQGLKAVLPIGYQTQMGSAWSAAHPDSLRRDSQGRVDRSLGVENASIYAPNFRSDMRRYYEWVDQRLVQPYRDTLLMLNLADEPIGGDYSFWADSEFFGQTGLHFQDVGTDDSRVIQLGAFQAAMMADYAGWAARAWAELEPDLATTMSFCTATARVHFELPSVEAVFTRTPSTFYPTYDAHPRDGPPEGALDDVELIRLFTLVRSIGHYSGRYQRPFWLWAGANSWGLGQASSQPANVADAVANGYYLAMLSRQTGGLLQGIAVWSYNTFGQGIYNDTHQTIYDPDAMFARVSESFPRIRQMLTAPAGRAKVLILAPDAVPYRLLGVSHSIDPYRFRSYDFHRLAALARNNVPSAVVSTLAGEELGGVTAIVVLAREAQDVPDTDVRQLQSYLAQGGTVIALHLLSPILGSRAIYVDGTRAEEALADPPTPEHTALWRRALGVEQPIADGFLVATADDALLYTIGTLRQVELHLPFSGRGWLADPSGLLVRRLTAPSGRLAIGLDTHHYVYLTR